MIWGKLTKLSDKALKTLLKSPRITASVFLIFVFIIVSIASGEKDLDRPIESQGPKVKGDSKNAISSPSVVPARFVTNENKSGISGEVTEEKIAPKPTIVVQEKQVTEETVSNVSVNSSGNSDLLFAVNAFRSASGGLASLSSSGSLCDVASKRLSELIALGSLDNHAGFNKYFQGQSEFNAMGEVIFSSSNQTSPNYAVNEGWAKSTSGHRENMLDTKWNFGCGATNGYFAVFNFGKK